MPPKRSKRPLTAKELRFILPTRRLRKDGKLRSKTKLHIARETVNGHIIQACNGEHVDLLSNYYFPFFMFILQNAPVCAACISVISDEMDAPVSNTGVNSKVQVTNDVTQ